MDPSEMDCNWCGDPIADYDCVVLVEWDYNESVDGHHPQEPPVAVFHKAPLPCFSEAEDYGWE